MGLRGSLTVAQSKLAWRTTADSALAIAYAMHVQAEKATRLTATEVQELFEDTRMQLQERVLSASTAALLRKNLIREYGYQFASFLISHSSMTAVGGELLQGTQCSHKQERRAKARYAKAFRGQRLREDKGVYWKEVNFALSVG
ncbi:hypothetical protein PINS_up015548 [Pythium insidiosum]|nr:hypothetical protein PINS_up015548 [Pythium insidiosum]